MSDPVSVSPSPDRKPYQCWHMATTFRKDGSPVTGSLGASSGEVIIMRVETFKRLCAENPALADARFEVGS